MEEESYRGLLHERRGPNIAKIGACSRTILSIDKVGQFKYKALFSDFNDTIEIRTYQPLTIESPMQSKIFYHLQDINLKNDIFVLAYGTSIDISLANGVLHWIRDDQDSEVRISAGLSPPLLTYSNLQNRRGHWNFRFECLIGEG